MTYYIYVLQCAGGTLYTGITPELQKRMRQHCGELAGGAKYTRSHPPEALLQVWQTDGHTAAARFEYAFKGLSRQKKLALLEAPTQWQAFLPELCEAGSYLPAAHGTLESYLKQHKEK